MIRRYRSEKLIGVTNREANWITSHMANQLTDRVTYRVTSQMANQNDQSERLTK